MSRIDDKQSSSSIKSTQGRLLTPLVHFGIFKIILVSVDFNSDDVIFWGAPNPSLKKGKELEDSKLLKASLIMDQILAGNIVTRSILIDCFNKAE